jgi:nucleoside phosphorylase
MRFTDQDVHEGRRLMNQGRANRLEIGDLLLAIAVSEQDGSLDEFCERIGLNPRTAREYRYTARMCTPPVRELIADSGVHVPYTALREGARLGPNGVPYDESYRTLRSLLAKAREEGADRISLALYQRELGTAPVLRDLLNPAAPDAPTAAQYVSALRDNPAREQIIHALVQQDAQLRDAVARSVSEGRRRERAQRAGEGDEENDGREADKGLALTLDLKHLGQQAVACMNRHPRAVKLTAEQKLVCEEAIGNLELLVKVTQFRTGLAGATSRSGTPAREPVAA